MFGGRKRGETTAGKCLRPLDLTHPLTTFPAVRPRRVDARRGRPVTDGRRLADLLWGDAMRRLIAVIAMMVGLSEPMSAQPTAYEAQGPITFQGCDGLRSCHTVVFTFSPDSWVGTDGQTFYRHLLNVTGTAQWNDRGAYKDCGLGCAWNTDIIGSLNGSTQADIFHASDRCWTVTLDPEGSRTGLANWCQGADEWYSGRPLVLGVHMGWTPSYVDVQLAYQADLFGAIETNTLRLAMVPEPSTWVLLLAGLVSVHLLRRRIRT